MTTDDKGFDGDAFYKALETVVKLNNKNWKQVAAETGVGASTLTRMAQGKKPDAAAAYRAALATSATTFEARHAQEKAIKRLAIVGG